MKVIILGTRGFPDVQGGVERHCEELSAALADLGCEVMVFTRRPYVDSGLKEYRGVRLVALPAFRNKSLEAFLHTFIGVVAAFRYRPDILHIQGIGPAFFSPLAKILGMNVVVTSHGPNYRHLKWGFIPRIILRLSELFGVLSADELIAVSGTIAGEIKRKYGRDPAIIPNGAPPPRISKDDAFIAKYGLTKGRYVLSVGRFVPEKGFHDLIEAFKDMEGWKLVIAGDADHQDRYSLDLKKKAAENSDIVLTGFLNERALSQLYSHAGVFALSSYYEGMPIALLEAMSYGLPCVASDIPANRELGLSETDLFRPGDVRALSGRLKEFTRRPSADGEGKGRTHEISEDYDWRRIARKTLEVYKKAGKEASRGKGVSIAEKISSFNRNRKWRLFLKIIRPDSRARVLDVGFSEEEYSSVDNFLEKKYPYPGNITALGLDEPGKFLERYPGVKAVRYKGGVFPFGELAFDVCWSNAVIEHVGDRQSQILFLQEIKRVARKAFITTPNKNFPIEVHTRTPFLHVISERLFNRYLVLTGRKWAAGGYMNLLSIKDIRGLLSSAGITEYKIIKNKFLFFTMDFIIIFGEI